MDESVKLFIRQTLVSHQSQTVKGNDIMININWGGCLSLTCAVFHGANSASVANFKLPVWFNQLVKFLKLNNHVW